MKDYDGVKYLITTLVLLLICPVLLQAQEDRVKTTGKENFRLKYVINTAQIDSSFSDLSNKITNLEDFLAKVKGDSLIDITGVDFIGTASPDGSYEFNRELSEIRLKAFRELVNSYINLPDSLINAVSSSIPWDEFRDAVAVSNVPMKTKVLEIIDEQPSLVALTPNKHIDHRLVKLKNLGGGSVWNALKHPILSDLRYGKATFYYAHGFPYVSPLQFPSCEITELPEVSIDVPEYVPPVIEYETYTPALYIKTNLAAWALAISNLGLEIDLAPHWSFAIPVNFSCWDYFKSTIKFRTLTYQPEFRYWPRSRFHRGNDGFFVGGHFSYSYYNLAFNGDHRYQDRDGKNPAIGGGLAIGYRLPISKNNRWHLEFSAGAGYYKLDYDIFENTPNYKKGELLGRKKKNYIGLDQLGITISYSIPFKRQTRTYEKIGGEL